MRIIYMGTPDFAVPALQMLYDNGYPIELVVTQPDKARDRGKKVQFTPVKEKALEFGLPVLQPEKIKNNEAFINQIKDLSPDLIIVAAYGKILPKEILEIPRLGCINIHASLLPKYRGAAPIHRCIINGDEKTGVTLMYMEEGLDTGDMLAVKEVDIERKTVAMLHEELADIGGKLLIETLPELESGQIKRIKQDDEQATYAPMVFKQDGEVSFSKSPEEIACLIRGLNSWPGAYTIYKGEKMKLWEADPIEEKSDKPFGTIVNVTKHGIYASAGGRILLIKKIQMPGKKAMPVSEYLKGNKIDIGTILGNCSRNQQIED